MFTFAKDMSRIPWTLF